MDCGRAEQSYRDFEETGINPFAYLRDLFGRISSHPQSRLVELLPDHWLHGGDAQPLTFYAAASATCG